MQRKPTKLFLTVHRRIKIAQILRLILSFIDALLFHKISFCTLTWWIVDRCIVQCTLYSVHHDLWCEHTKKSRAQTSKRVSPLKAQLQLSREDGTGGGGAGWGGGELHGGWMSLLHQTAWKTNLCTCHTVYNCQFQSFLTVWYFYTIQRSHTVCIAEPVVVPCSWFQQQDKGTVSHNHTR